MVKLCPLLLIAKSGAAECTEECAWYVIHERPKAEGCAIAELSNSLKTASLKIAELSMKK